MTSRRVTGLVAVTAAVYVALAVVGWYSYVVMRPLDGAHLAGLVETSPPAGFSPKPASSGVEAAASNPFSTFKTIAARSPSATAGYSVTWTNPKAASDSATILVSYLPSAADARRVETQAETRFLQSGSFKAQKYAYSAPVDVPGVPGGKGAVFRATGSATTPPVAVAVFATGRAQVLVLLGRAGTTAATGSAAAALAREEYAHLRQVLPTFEMHTTSVPPVATAVYWIVAASVAAALVGVPMGIRRARRLRREARLRTAHRQRQVRGSKIARRQAVRRR